MKKISDILYFVFKDLYVDGFRSLITIVNLLVFISCYFGIVAYAEATYKFGHQPTDKTALIMISLNIFDPQESIVTNQDLLPAEEMIPKYVNKISPVIFKYLKVNGYLVQVRATRLEDMQSVHSLKIVRGEWPDGKKEVIIGEGIVAFTNWKIGDTLHIFGNDFLVVGVVSAPGTKFSSVWMTLDTAYDLLSINGEYQIGWIQLQPNVDPEMVRTSLQNDPRIINRFEVYYADNLYKQFTNALSDMQGLSGILLFLALCAVMLGTYCNIFLILTERRREITILRAIGMQSKAVRAIITLRMLIQVTISYLLSWGITSIVLNWFNQIDPMSLNYNPLPVYISGLSLLVGYILCLIFGGLGVLIPTRHLRTRSVASFIS